VSSAAQQYLATGHPLALPVDFADNITAIQEVRQFSSSSNTILSNKAKQQYLDQTFNSTIAGVPVVYGVPKGFKEESDGPKLIIYLHGGGYVFNSCYSQWSMVALVAQASSIQVICVEYRLAPEHPFPAGLNDALAVYKQLLQPSAGAKAYDASSIAVLGDSAGGGMALALTVQLQREGVAVPGALVLFSPWVDVTNKGDTLTTLLGPDPAICFDCIKPLAYAYTNESKFADPLVSPLRANYASLFENSTFPPTLIQMGTRDSLLSGGILLYRKLKAAGQTGVVFSPWEAMWHDFQQLLAVPEAQAAQQEAATFISAYLGGSCKRTQQCAV
jgi:acetyl esterase/lipase